MDKYKSLELEKLLKNKSIAGYEVIQFINNGKSAAVFKAVKDGKYYALKIFDNDLIERFGHEIQTVRIEQEISLKNHDIDNLVKIYEGGNTILGDNKYYYIVMELIDGKNLKDYINENEFNQDFIINVLNKLINTTDQLLSKKNIVHRDIKPENIMVNQSNDVILMDLGVLKFIGASSLSDEDEVSFVGTLRYAPPEFLTRKEENSFDGWKAVNLYQIGATLHDLIMKQELFKDETPYSNLVIAICSKNPKILNQSISFELIQLTRNMLSKDWKKRLEIVNLDMIKSINNFSDDDLFHDNLNKLMKLREKPQSLLDEIELLQKNKEEKNNKKIVIGSELFDIIHKCLFGLKKHNIYKEIFFTPNNFHLHTQDGKSEDYIKNVLFAIKGDLEMGYPKPLFIFVRLINDDSGFCKVNVNSFFYFGHENLNLSNPEKIIKNIYKNNSNYTLQDQINRVQRQNNFEIKFISFFEGIVEFDDEFEKLITNNFMKLITKSLVSVDKIVEQELEIKKERLESNLIRSNCYLANKNSILIDSLD